MPAIWVSRSWTRLLVSISVRLRVSRSWSRASISAPKLGEALLGEGDIAFDRLELGLPGGALGRTLALLGVGGRGRGKQGRGHASTIVQSLA